VNPPRRRAARRRRRHAGSVNQSAFLGVLARIWLVYDARVMCPRRSQSRAWPAYFLVVALGASAAGAVAKAADAAPPFGDPTTEWLDWTLGPGAESCAGNAAFASQVAAQLGQPPADAARRWKRRLSITIQRQPARPRNWSAELRLIAADGSIAGTRRMERDEESCAPVVEALALMTSLVLAEAPAAETPGPAAAPAPRAPAGGAATPDSPTAEAPETASPEPPTAPEPPPPAPPPPPPVPPPISPLPGSAGTAAASREPPAIDLRPPRLATGAGIAGGAGLLPRMAAGAEVHIALAIAPFPTLFASGTIWRSQSAFIDGSNSGSTLGLWLAGLGLCPIDHRWTTRSFSACLGGEVGRLHAAGVGFPQAFDQDHWAADVTTGARVRQAIDGSGFYLAAAVRLAVPLLRGRILFGDANGAPAEIFRMWPVAVIAGLEAGYAFN
jgi:hypothetical protein